MPRGDPRALIAFRIAPKGRKWIEELAAEHEVDNTTVFKAALAVAKNHEAELKSTIKSRSET